MADAVMEFAVTHTLMGREITARVIQLPKGIQVTLSGGDLPHIGAVSIAEPDGNISTNQFPSHREGGIAAEWAAALVNAGLAPAVVAVGIHYDNLSREGIAAVVQETQAMLAEVLARLNG